MAMIWLIAQTGDQLGVVNGTDTLGLANGTDELGVLS